MSSTFKQNLINIREVIAGLFQPKYAEKLIPTFVIGDASETSFDVSAKHEPFQVFDGQALMKEGVEYTIADNGIYKTVKFSTAPANLNDVTIYSYKRIN